MDYATPAMFVGVAIGAALMWGACKWYYTKGGKTKLAKKQEEELAALKELAKKQGWILNE